MLIEGTSIADILQGTPGDDMIFGFRGNDVLFGGAGDDVILGGNGKDELHATGGGNNTLTGGEGADVFVFSFSPLSPEGSVVRITDFQDGIDKLAIGSIDFWLENLASGNAVFSMQNGDAHITLEDNPFGTAEPGVFFELIVEDTKLNSLSADDLVTFAQPGSVLELSDLDGSNGFVINGINAGDFSGWSVSGVGDINGDGIDDVIIGAKNADPNGQIDAGENYVVFGSDAGFDASLELSDLDGSNGFVINGIEAGDLSGKSVSGAGDINGDGIDDLIIGAVHQDPNGTNYTGESYVVFGSDAGFDATLDLSDLDGSTGFVLKGINRGDRSGTSVSGAGDINGDGFDDLVIGALYADPINEDAAGETYVVFGSDAGFDETFNLSDLDGSNGFVINGIDAGDASGTSVHSAGDVNGDGIDDLVIGARYADPNDQMEAGETYVVFGSDEGFAATFDLSDLDGSNGFVINGIDAGDASGTSVHSAGDINGDGIDDLVIGAQLGDPNGVIDAGETYVVFGSDAGFDATFELSDLDGSNGFVINGFEERFRSGKSVSGAGDINGDGIDDLIIGSRYADSNGQTQAGETYVVFGSDAGFDASLELSDLDGNNGFVIQGINAGDNSGKSVSGAGDINGDGIDDLIIGAHLADPNGNSNAGEAYVLFGSDAGFAAQVSVQDLALVETDTFLF